jgi:hypothetical protein
VLDVGRVSRKAMEDVAEFMEENEILGSPVQLEPRVFFDYYLKWNGILGYSDTLIELLEQLGWRLEQTNKEA